MKRLLLFFLVLVSLQAMAQIQGRDGHYYVGNPYLNNQKDAIWTASIPFKFGLMLKTDTLFKIQYADNPTQVSKWVFRKNTIYIDTSIGVSSIHPTLYDLSLGTGLEFSSGDGISKIHTSAATIGLTFDVNNIVMQEDLETHQYSPTSSTITRGTQTGTYADAIGHDGTYWVITEQAGAIGLNIEANFSLITHNPNRIIFHGHYDGTHSVVIQLYNYSSATWENYNTLTPQTTNEWIEFSITDPDEHVSSGNAKIRFYHSSNGNITDKLYIDYLLMISGIGSAVADALDWNDTVPNAGIGVATYNDIRTAAVTNGATTLTTGDQVYDFVTGQGYTSGGGYTLVMGGPTALYSDGATWFAGVGNYALTLPGNARIYAPTSGTITKVYAHIYGATAGDADAWPVSISVDQVNYTTVATLSVSAQDRVWSNTGMSLAVTAGQYVSVRWVNPSWVNNPGSSNGFQVVVWIEY